MCAIRLSEDEGRLLCERLAEAQGKECACVPADRPVVEEALNRLIRWANLGPRPVRWCRSPLEAQRLLAEGGVDQSGGLLGADLNRQYAALLGMAGAVLRLNYIVRNFGVLEKENSPVAGQRELYQFTITALHRELRKERRETQVYTPWMRGHNDAARCAILRFARDVLGIAFDAQMDEWLEIFEQLSGACGWIYWCENEIIACERPTTVRMVMRRDDRGRMRAMVHDAHGPVLAYSDGWRVWALNGVIVPQEVVETPADELDARLLLSEPNAEVRREIVRKIGLDRVFEQLGAETLDGSGDYELVNLDMGDGRRRPYLKMVNPSTGQVHLEGVPPSVRTVAEALAWRNDIHGVPEVLS